MHNPIWTWQEREASHQFSRTLLLLQYSVPNLKMPFLKQQQRIYSVPSLNSLFELISCEVVLRRSVNIWDTVNASKKQPLQKGRTEEQSLKNRNEEKEIKCSTFFGCRKDKNQLYLFKCGNDAIAKTRFLKETYFLCLETNKILGWLIIRRTGNDIDRHWLISFYISFWSMVS